MNKSKIIVFLLVTLAVGFWIASFVFKVNAPKSKASGETMNLSFNPATTTVAVNADFTVSLLAKPSVSTILRGYKTRINFDKAILKLKSIQYKAGVVSAGLGNTDADLTTINGTGSANIIGEDSTATGTTVTPATGVEIAIVTFTAITNAPTTVLISDSDFYSINTDMTLQNTWTYAPVGLNVNGESVKACTSFSDDFSGTSLSNDNWDAYPSISNVSVNNEATINIAGSQGLAQAKTAGLTTKNTIIGDFYAEVVLKYLVSSTSNSSNLSFFVSSINPGSTNNMIQVERKAGSDTLFAYNALGTGSPVDQASVSLGLTSSMSVKVKIERKGNIVNVYYDILDGQGYKLLKAFNIVSSSEVKLSILSGSFETSYPNVEAKFGNFNLTCPGEVISSPSPTGIISYQITPTLTPLPTPTGSTGNVNLNMKLKFQGITKQPATAQNSMNVKVKVYSEGVTTPYEGNGAFTSDASGIWSGKIGVNITSVSGKYKIFVKGAQHLQKKICEATPTEATPGVYRCATGNISLVTGDNNLDFSGLVLLVGDLDQNGIVDSVDFGLVRNNLGKSDAAVLATSDLNRDGKVDTQDFSLIIAALGVRTDEL